MLTFEVAGKKYQVEELATADALITLIVNGKKVIVKLLEQQSSMDKRDFLAKVNSRVFRVRAPSRHPGKEQVVWINRKVLNVQLEEVRLPAHESQAHMMEQGPVVIEAPMSGRITSVKKLAGSTVQPSESLFLLEAMKMENDIASPKEGILKEVYVKAGALVKMGDKLALVE
jgi:biotin carboxyl carrier protein